MGFIEKLASSLMEKYWNDSEGTCEAMEVKDTDDPKFPHLLKGVNCTISAGPFKFSFPKAYTKTNLNKNEVCNK